MSFTVRHADRQLPRVLVVSARLDVGGTEQHLLRTLPLLRQRGLDISLFVLERGGKLEGAMSAAGISVAGPPQRRLPRLPHALLTCIYLRRYLGRLKPDIVHFFLSEPYLIGSFAAFGIKSIDRIMSRRSLGVYQARHRILSHLERWLHGRTRILLGNSSAVVADLLRECGDNNKIGLIRNGIETPVPVNLNKRRMARVSLCLPDESFVIAVNANLIPYKGHRDLFEALGLIKEMLSAPWTVLLIGRDHGCSEELYRLAEVYGFLANVIWLGERSDVQRILPAADVVVLPSHEEGFSNSLIEAMGCGLPVIATAVGGNIDAVTHEETGLLTPPRDPQKLGAALLRLYRNSDLRSHLGSAARARVLSNFSIDDCVARYLNLYQGWRSYGSIAIQHLIDGKSSNGLT